MPLRRLLQSELEQICDDVVQMGDMVEQAVRRAAEALVDQDMELAQQVVAGDEAVNELRFAIEESCLTLLATQQPTAIDLRTVVTALNIITDLERMGDYAKGIGQMVVRADTLHPTGGQDLIWPSRKASTAGFVLRLSPKGWTRMARVVCDMMRNVLDAFVEADAEVAQRVCDMDDEVDHMYRGIFESVLQSMVHREHGVRAGMHLLFAAHNLERIGDRVTNIGERVIFMVTGVMEERNW